MKYLFDTNICIYLINKRGDDFVRNRMEHCVPGDIGISTMTLSELTYGIAGSRDVLAATKALHAFLSPLVLCDFESSAAWEYGSIRNALKKKGKIIGSMDLLIAAHARSLGVTLVTNNEKEFSRVKGLAIENWTM